MKLVKYHSHLSGWEHVRVHRPGLWQELQDVIATVAACDYRTLMTRFGTELVTRGWSNRKPSGPSTAELNPARTGCASDFVKDRVHVGIRFGEPACDVLDLFAMPLALFIGHVMDVGVEIVPMKSMEQEMSSGVPYYERALYHLLAQGRSTPAVPLVLVGIAP